MAAAIKTSIVMRKELLVQAEVLAQRLNISQNDLFEQALADFIRNHADEKVIMPVDEKRPVINQGDIYWVQLAPNGLEPAIPHPHVVIQADLLNHSRITTTVVCALTSNIKRASLPGHVLLDAGEANLPRQSVVETSKVSSIDKAQLGAYIGSLTEERIAQLLAGMRFLQASFFDR